MKQNEKLVVIIPDLLSNLSNKGEIIDRYYNPNNRFNEVHIIMTNDDDMSLIKLEIIQKSVGTAKLFLHQVYTNSKMFLTTLGWRPWLLNTWCSEGIELLESIKPTLVRCHGNRLNSYLAYKYKKKCGVPYIVSMHSNPDVDDSMWLNKSIVRGIHTKLISRIGEKSLKNCDMAIAVYDAIMPYYKRLKLKKVALIYNVINPENLKIKKDYTLHSPIRLLCVGRQVVQKNPINIIRAVEEIEDVQLMIIGKGPIHQVLVDEVKKLNLSHKVEFLDAMDNDEICNLLVETDIFITNIKYWGIPKAILEPLLTGVPVVVNESNKYQVSEYRGNHIMTVEDTPQGYKAAINKLIVDGEFREQMGKTAFAHSRELWDPAILEQKIVDVYNDVIESR